MTSLGRMRRLTGILLVAAAVAGCGGGSGKPHAAAATSPPACPGYAQARTAFDTFKSGMADGSLTASQADPVLQQLASHLASVEAATNPTVQTAAKTGAQDATKLDAALTSGDNSGVSAVAGDLRLQMDTLAAYC